jgi:transcriptional regulator with XRE-family HTH domain
MSANHAEQFWRRIDQILKEQGLKRGDLKKRVKRNKNTYSRWFSKKPTDPKLSDVIEISLALSIDPAMLLADHRRESTQLSLPFPESGVSAQIEMYWTGNSIVIRKFPTSEAQPGGNGALAV